MASHALCYAGLYFDGHDRVDVKKYATGCLDRERVRAFFYPMRLVLSVIHISAMNIRVAHLNEPVVRHQMQNPESKLISWEYLRPASSREKGMSDLDIELQQVKFQCPDTGESIFFSR